MEIGRYRVWKVRFTFGVGRRDLTYEQGVKTIDWLFKDEVSQSNEIEVSWWGGEPFVAFEMMKRLTDYTKEKAVKEGKRVSFGGTSNTTLMTKEAVDWMDQYKAYFLLSIDGPKDVQDANRPLAVGGSSWDKLAANLPYATRKIPHLGSRMSPTPTHIHRMAETFRFLYDEYNITSQMFSPVNEVPWSKQDLTVAEEQLKLIADMIIEKRLEGKHFDVKHLDDGARIIESSKNTCEYPCGAGRFYVGISVDGVIYPCHRFNKYDGSRWQDKAYIGTIDDGILRPDFRNQFIHYLEQQPPEKCRDCELYGNLCDRPCYAVAYDLAGDINATPDQCCNWWWAQARAIRYYHQQLKKNNLPIPGMNEGGSMMNACICNNMCYMEGTDQQVINVDPGTDAGCVCNNSNYSGDLDAPARNLTATERMELLEKLKATRPGVPVSNEGAELLRKLYTQLERTEQTNALLAEAVMKLAAVLQTKAA